jgi:hypothetical protein
LGASTNLTANGGSNYLWNPGNSTSNPYTVSPASTQIYTLSGTNNYGCADTAYVTVTVNTVDTSVTAGPVTLTSNQTGTATYQWIDCNNGNAAISGQTSQTFIASANGSYAVIATANGCTDTSACYIITSVGIVKYSVTGNAIIVYPNPSSGNFGITLFSAKEAPLRIELSDAIGQTVFADVMKANVGENKIVIADKNLAKGIYLLRVDIGENKYLNKVIVQ